MPKLSAADFRKQGYKPHGQWCLLYGPEYELKLRLRSAIIEAVISPAEREFAVETIVLAKGSQASAIVGAAQTSSVLTAARVLVVENIEDLSAGEQRELARSLRASPGSVVILMEGQHAGRRRERAATGEQHPGGDRRGRLTAELLRAVAETGTVVECAALGREEAVAAVREQAAALGTPLQPAAAALLVERVGTDLGHLAREVEKLSLFASGEEAITTQHIEEASARTPEDNIFSVGDAIGAGDAERALAVLRDLVQYQGVEPTTALAFISRQFRLVWQAKVLADAGWRRGDGVPPAAESLLPADADIRSYLESRGWLVNRLVGQARRFSWPQLAYAVQRILDAELALKGIGEKTADQRVALEMLLLDLCQSGRSAARAAAPG